MLTNIILLHIYILYKTVFFFFVNAQFNIVCALRAHLTVTIGIAKRWFGSVWGIIIDILSYFEASTSHESSQDGRLHSRAVSGLQWPQ